MNNEQLQSILREYRPSMKLVVMVEKKSVLETSVAEMLIRLIAQPRDASLTFCGRPDCIIRERGEDTDDVPGAAPYREWLEMDMR